MREHLRELLLAFAQLLVILAPLSASATFHLWDITEVGSNADGSVQFVELEVVNPSDDESLVGGHFLKSNSTTYTIPTNIASTTTTHYLLFATPAFGTDPGSDCPTPDFVLPAANFLSTVADTINFANVDTFTYASGQLPTDQVSSLNEPFASNVRTTAFISPTNWNGDTSSPLAPHHCTLPEPSAGLGLLAGSAVVLALSRTRRT